MCALSQSTPHPEPLAAPTTMLQAGRRLERNETERNGTQSRSALLAASHIPLCMPGLVGAWAGSEVRKTTIRTLCQPQSPPQWRRDGGMNPPLSRRGWTPGLIHLFLTRVWRLCHTSCWFHRPAPRKPAPSRAPLPTNAELQLRPL